MEILKGIDSNEKLQKGCYLSPLFFLYIKCLHPLFLFVLVLYLEDV